MLSPARARYVAICAARIASPRASREELAAQFDTTASTVDHAIDYGRSAGLFVRDACEKVTRHIAELQAVAGKLERVFNRLCRSERPQGAWVAALARQLLDYRTRIMELEGLYKQTVNLQHTGADGGPMRVEYELVDVVDAPGPN